MGKHKVPFMDDESGDDFGDEEVINEGISGGDLMCYKEE